MFLLVPPRPVRLAVFAAAIALILYLSLAPTTAIPSVNLWDKLEHATAYLGLTVLGIWCFPASRWKVFAALVAVGAGVEIAQATMGFGRDGDIRDAVANTIGAAIGLVIAWIIRWLFLALSGDRSSPNG